MQSKGTKKYAAAARSRKSKAPAKSKAFPKGSGAAKALKARRTKKKPVSAAKTAMSTRRKTKYTK